jgi:hypothetical protein
MNEREFEIFKILFVEHLNESKMTSEDIEHVSNVACDIVKYADFAARKYHAVNVDEA